MSGVGTQGQDCGWRNWLAVVMLGVGAFVVVATELAPIGMLSGIAGDLAQSPGRTGLVVTAYAWIGALAALAAVLTVSGWPRRPLLLGMMLLLALSNGAAAASGSFNALLAARLLGALAHGAFWAMAATLGAQLVPARLIGRATAIIFGGVSVASVLGVPLVNVISNHAGWRAAFACLSLLALAAGLALAISLPRMAGGICLRPTQLLSVLGNGELRWLYAIAAGAIVAHFAVFTYVEVLLSSRMRVSAEWVAICLFAFGAAGIAGNLLCGVLIDRCLKGMLAAALLTTALCLLVIGSGIAQGAAAATLLALGWGMAVSVLFVGIQAGAIRLAGDAALPASAISAAIFNSALGAGALAGAGVLDSWGSGALCLSAAAIAALCSGLVRQLRRANAAPEN
ncbi:MFS transporter [Brenneria populi subsp. brevivirga]|uniref:MFS transporter n=1 Tax=Brenneria populi TaxID=1505588 RepID=UPI002E17F776|nr:MFS transporter [Brenneria populi subsp. brevivirga]